MEYTLSAVRLFVSDLERAKNYYSITIGMPLAVEDLAHGYFMLDTGVVKLLVEQDDGDGDDEPTGRSPKFMPYSFAVKDITKAFGELTSKGVEFIHPPEKQFWGGTLAYFKDPDGNVMTLVEY